MKTALAILALAGTLAAIAIQWGRFQQTAILAEETARQLRAHEQDNTRHMDQWRYDEISRRLERIERKLDEQR